MIITKIVCDCCGKEIGGRVGAKVEVNIPHEEYGEAFHICEDCFPKLGNLLHIERPF